MMKLKSSIPLLIAIAALFVLPLVIHNPYYIHLAETILIYTILLFGLDIVVGYVGQVSLGHAALFGIGSYTAGILFFHLGLPIWVTIPASVIVTAFFGGILALPALKVVGPYLAMVTLAFGTIAQILINEMTWLTEGPLGIKLTRPELMGVPMTKAEYFWLVAATTILALIVVDRFVKSQMGRAFEALRDSPVACDCMGVSVYRFKVIAFVISAGFAGLAGCLYAYSEQYISPNTYNNELAVLFLLGIIMGGRKSRLGAVIGAAIIVLLPKLLDDINAFRIVASVIAVVVTVGALMALSKKITTPRRVAVPLAGVIGLAAFSFWLNSISDWRLSIFGFMILLVVYYLQNGIVGFAKSFYQSIVGKAKTTRGGDAEEVDDSVSFISAVGSQNSGAELLKVDSVLMQFGGLKALNNVDLSIKRGTIHGLIGPNGSGKSTMMNVLTGIYVPTAGNVLYAGQSVVGKTSSDIALSGIARTFQNVQLFGEMTAIQNILVGLHHTFRSNMVEIAFHLPRYKKEEADAHARAMALLKFVGLDDLANEEARNLPYGKQRLLEIARALALDPELLLLDEPAAGLTAPDIKELLRIIRKIRDNGITFILIEHHMDVVMSVCDTVSVLDFGQKIAEGKPAEVQANEKVIHAYLGT
jgi:ABC-type branched-subunit amino acid transport system ATPase component/ABC-type branched-subunit amino acid transport system permease subunit